MAESAYTTQGVYETQMIEHGFMEPEACVAYPIPSPPNPLSHKGRGGARPFPAPPRSPPKLLGGRIVTDSGEQAGIT